MPLSGVAPVPDTSITSSSNSPWAIPTEWDTVTFAGTVPYGPTLTVNGSFVGGLCEIKKALRYYKLDQKDGSGSDGATTTYRGVRPRKFDIVLHIWTQDQHEYYEATILPLLLQYGTKNTTNNPAVQALAVYSPKLIQIGITSILIESIGQYDTKAPGDTWYTVALSVEEFMVAPPINTTATPSNATATDDDNSVGRQPNPVLKAALDANAALKARVDELKLPQVVP